MVVGRAVAFALVALVPAVADAQIRGRPPVGDGGSIRRGPDYGWWFSGGAAGLVMGAISDGASGKRWDFGSDPLWQLRGTLEKARDNATTLGISAGYGVVDVNLSTLPGFEMDAPTTAVCVSTCRGQVETWQLMGQFRSGGGPGFHTFFEAQGGVNGFRNLRINDSTKTAIGPSKMQIDPAGSLGFGFGYTLSPGLVIGLVQDFGIGWHSQRDLPDGTGRTYRTRATRASLRFRF